MSLVVTQGNNATFSVTASGDVPLSYQWRFNDTVLSGATTSNLTVSSAQATNAGNYDVIVSNNSGSVTSQVATLTVRVPPLLTQQPTSLIVTQGNNATFNVTANGDAPLSYQWRFNGAAISGATANNFTVTNAQATNAGNYQVIVSNNAGSVTSAVATLTVRVPPSITQQPASLIVTQGNKILLQEPEEPLSGPLSGTQVIKIGQLGVSKVTAGTYVLTLVVTDTLEKKARRMSRSIDFTVVD